TQPADLREQVTAELERIDGGAPVHPIYEAVRTAVEAAQEHREADLHQLATDALARAKNAKTKKRTPRPKPVTDDGGEPVQYPVRAFVLTWTELTDWWAHYDIDQLTAALTDEQIDSFLATAEGTSRIAEELRAARDRRNDIESVPARGHLRALGSELSICAIAGAHGAPTGHEDSRPLRPPFPTPCGRRARRCRGGPPADRCRRLRPYHRTTHQ